MVNIWCRVVLMCREPESGGNADRGKVSPASKSKVTRLYFCFIVVVNLSHLLLRFLLQQFSIDALSMMIRVT